VGIARARRSRSRRGDRPERQLLDQVFVGHDPIFSCRQYSIDALQLERMMGDNERVAGACGHLN
jgi:hypothetical protein